MTRIDRENARNEARRPVRKVHMYADKPALAAIQQVMGPQIKEGFIPDPTDWRIVHRKPNAAFQGFHEGEGQLSWERRIKRAQVPEAFTDPIPDFWRPGVGTDVEVARILHSRRKENVEEDFGKRLSTPPGKKIRKKRRDPLFTSVHYPGDNPRK